MKRYVAIVLTILLNIPLWSTAQIERVEPPSWWTGMKDSSLQIMIYGKNIGKSEVSLIYPGAKITEVHRTNNSNYLFVDLVIAPNIDPGNLVFSLNGEGGKQTFEYFLKERSGESAERRGFSNADVIYLLMPDRFANGDRGNDEIEGLREGLNMSDKYGRHGGDLQGISDHINYFRDMGFTALWLNPVLKNDQEKESYHGYAITDFYKVDPRLGTNEQYAELSKNLKDRGIKLIMDMVFNHCGSEHWWMKDLPDSTWINNYPDFFITNHLHILNEDPYASETDIRHLVDGWFVSTMPDLNERDPLLAKYLIQNSIWWIEYAGLAGIRMDTYPYNDKEFMAEWNRRVLREYPHFNIVGEEWSDNQAVVAYWQKGQHNRDGYRPDLPSLMDFPMQSALVKAMNEKEEGGNTLINLFNALAMDYLYPDPFNLVIFADNHDMSRFFMQVNQDTSLFKLGMAYILTTRGIPQIFYGTEILMTHPGSNEHGDIRKDFPGGWPGDQVNGFTGEGLQPDQLSIQNYLRQLINWRKNEEVLHSGKILHYSPQNDAYVYFRYNDTKRIMVVLNKNNEPTELEMKRFSQGLHGLIKGKDVISGKSYDLTSPILLPARRPLILELE